MTGKTRALKFKISYDTEADYDYVVVEAHTVGQDDWTTLPEENGGHVTDAGPGAALLGQLGGARRPHPFIAHYMNPDARARPTGTTGDWNAATGNSGGFQDWEFDLSAYAGKQIEVSISLHPGLRVTGLGVFVDDADGR